MRNIPIANNLLDFAAVVGIIFISLVVVVHVSKLFAKAKDGKSIWKELLFIVIFGISSIAVILVFLNPYELGSALSRVFSSIFGTVTNDIIPQAIGK